MFLNRVQSYFIKKLFTSTIYWSKVDDSAIIPTKREEDGCFDFFALPDEPHKDIVIYPKQIVTVRTGIATAFHPLFRFNVQRERGSSGSAGIVLRCGQIDSGYRGEWFLKLQTATDNVVIITEHVKEVTKDKEDRVIYWPITKAVCQAAYEFSPPTKSKVVDYAQLRNINSERGLGKLGSTQK